VICHAEMLKMSMRHLQRALRKKEQRMLKKALFSAKHFFTSNTRQCYYIMSLDRNIGCCLLKSSKFCSFSCVPAPNVTHTTHNVRGDACRGGQMQRKTNSFVLFASSVFHSFLFPSSFSVLARTLFEEGRP
jgi:hypothetical protein